jgi:hypothetical protein
MSSRTGALSELLVGLLDKPEDLHGDTALCMGDGRPRKRSRIDMVGTAEAIVVAPRIDVVQRERGGAASADVAAGEEPKQPRKARTSTAMMVTDVSEGEDRELWRLDGLQPGYEQPCTDSVQASRPRKRKAVTDSATPHAASSAASSSAHPPKTFECSHPGCGKSFSEKGNLTKHKHIHTGVRPFVCSFPGCDKSFTQKGNLTTHVRMVHTNDRPFTCSFPGCDKSFTQASHLTTHVRMVHTNDRPFTCSFPGCDKSFTQASHLAEHVSTFHMDERMWTRRGDVARREAQAQREEEKALLERILAAPWVGLLALLRRLDGENELPRCAYGVGGLYVAAFRDARARPALDDATRGAEASASSDGVDALEAASEDDEADEMEEVAQLGTTSDEARDALELLSRLRPRLGDVSRKLEAELARAVRDMRRVILVAGTLAAAAAARGEDAATLDEEARAGAESLRACFEGRASTAGSTVPAVATLAEAPAEEQEAGGEPMVVEAWAAATPSSEGGGRLREKVGRWLIRVKRHTTYPESSADAEQERLRLLSPDDRMLFLGGRRPGESDTWDGTGDGSQALFSQFVSLPLSDALPAHIESVEGCWVRLEVGTDIVAACAPFAVATRAHAGRLGMSPEAIERTVALNMSACLAACGSFEMPSDVQGAKAYYRILRVECYGGNGEESAANKTHRESVTLPVYNAMRTGHLYLQRYGHPGGRPSWGMSLRGAGRGKVLVRAVARVGGDGEGELGMTEWALTVAEALGLKPEAFHEPTCVGDVFTSQLVRLVL